MNFFKHQDTAHKKTGLLVALLCLAVIILIGISVFAISVFFYYFGQGATSAHMSQALNTSFSEHLIQLAGSELTLYVASAVIAVVMAGSAWKFLQLNQGGRSIAEMLGGRRIDPASQDPNERKVLNVVEEMALASGNPVPPVYLLQENGINAFAAGLTRRDAVIGVTLGCVQQLSRDELQGVIAHEFSHIHNGDMRLNMRLTAILHGILLIGLIGEMMIHGGFTGYGYHRRSRSKEEKNIAALGILLFVVGYTGTFFGNIIKSAVSRQREFLADASAVQFTRNPLGISGALKKIGGATHHGQIENGRAAEFSHFYFAQGIRTWFSALTSTHPPLEKRIKRIEPSWRGQFIASSPVDIGTPQSGMSEDAISAFEGHSQPVKQSTESNKRDSVDQAIEFESIEFESIEKRIGEASPETLAKAQQDIHTLPPYLYDACHEAYLARGIIYGMLLERTDKEIRHIQLKRIRDKAHPATVKAFAKIVDVLKNVPSESYLTVLNLCMPALKSLSQPQYSVFKKNIIALIQADKKVTLLEWCLFRILVTNIEIRNIREDHNLSSCKSALITLFSAVAAETHRDASAEVVFKAGLNTLPSKLNLQGAKYNRPESFRQLDQALKQLERLKPLQKPAVLKALATIINADGHVSMHEKMVFRAVGDTLNCPLPPL